MLVGFLFLFFVFNCNLGEVWNMKEILQGNLAVQLAFCCTFIALEGYPSKFFWSRKVIRGPFV